MIKKTLLSRKNNYLSRVEEVLSTYKLYKTEDITIIETWKKYIYPKHHVSLKTLSRYLSVNKKIEKIKAKKKYAKKRK